MQIVRNEEQLVEVYYRPTDPFSNVIGNGQDSSVSRRKLKG